MCPFKDLYVNVYSSSVVIAPNYLDTNQIATNWTGQRMPSAPWALRDWWGVAICTRKQAITVQGAHVR